MGEYGQACCQPVPGTNAEACVLDFGHDGPCTVDTFDFSDWVPPKLVQLTPSDIIEYLRAYPEQAVEVMGAVTVVGDWNDGRPLLNANSSVTREHVPGAEDAASYVSPGTEWRWRAGLEIGHAPTREEAMAAADAALDIEWIVVNRRVHAK